MPRQEDIELSGNQKFILNLVDRVAGIITLGIKSVVTLASLASVVFVIDVLAEHGFKADINVNANANVAVYLFSLLDSKTRWLPWGVALIAIIYGLIQRELRRRKTAYLQGRIVRLEQQIDPGRTSSGLTTRGETRGEDV